MTEYVDAFINDKYPIVLPDFRREFHEKRPHWEAGRLESCAELMKPGMTVYDIGAEHGDFTALYQKWVHPGTVVPVEPAAHYWPFIRGTLEANGYTTPPRMSFVGLISDMFLMSKHGLHLDRWPTATEGEGKPDGGFVHLRHSTTEPFTRIDVLAQTLPPDAIVLDIEGAEYLALFGAHETLREHRPIVYVSVHDVGDGAGWNGPLKDWYGKTVDDIHSLMYQYDYSRELLPSHGEGESFWKYEPK